jgi:hypothetical protein
MMGKDTRPEASVLSGSISRSQRSASTNRSPALAPKVRYFNPCGFGLRMIPVRRCRLVANRPDCELPHIDSLVWERSRCLYWTQCYSSGVEDP